MPKLAIKANVIFSSARRYLRFGNPVFRKYSAAEWTFKKTGFKEITNHNKALQELWLEGLGIKELDPIDQLISFSYAYLDIKNYHAEKLIDKLFEMQIISEHRPVVHENKYQNRGYFESLLEDNQYSSQFFNNPILQNFSLAERFYISLAMSYPLPWSALGGLLESDFEHGHQDMPKRFLRLIKLLKAFKEGPELNFDQSFDLKCFIDSFTEITDEARVEFRTALPEKIILLVEGTTELLALPHLAKCISYDFNKLGVAIISVGGKSQVLKQYQAWANETKLPIRIILDADATSQIEELQSQLRVEDKLFVIQEGEFEDCFDLETVVDLANQILLAGQLQISSEEFEEGARRTLELNRIWRKRGMGNFDKVAFANSVIDCIDSESQVPLSLKSIIQDICCEKSES